MKVTIIQGENVAEENNIGASRLIGTNGLQSAADSVTAKLNSIANAASNVVGAFNNIGSANRGGTSNSVWNAGSNNGRYGSNGGGASFAGLGTGGFGGARGGNGGGGSFSGGSLSRGNKIATTFSAAAGVASAVTQYGNKNMNGMMQMNYFGTQAALAGGAQGGVNTAQRMVFANNYAALNVNDAAQAGYISQYTFGNSMMNGSSNPSFTNGFSQVKGLGYMSPTMGATAAAQAAQQTFSARSRMMGQAYGLNTLSPNATIASVAQSMMNRTWGGKTPTVAQFNAAVAQNGGLNVNMQYWGQQMGWSQSTIQEYQDLMQGQVVAQSKGMSASQYNTLTQQAGNGDKNAQNQLKKIGIGTSAYEAQRNLNSTRMTRQEDVNESMASAFTKTTDVVNQFSQALTALMKNTGLDKLLGTSAGMASPVSSALSGFSGAFGAIGGLYGASRLFGGAGGVLGGFFGRGSAAAAGSRLGSMGANGAYNITTLGAGSGAAVTGAGVVAVTGLAAVGAGNQSQRSTNTFMNKGGADTSAFVAYMTNHMSNSKAKRQAAAQQWLSDHPGAQVDPKQLQLMGGISSTSSAPAGYGQGANTKLTDGGSSMGNGSSSGTGANAAAVIRAAETQLGVPYVWGGETPGKAMDCSGLTQWAYGQVGVKIPRVAADQQKSAKAVDKNKTQAGDLLFVGNPAHHVVMSIGGGKIIEAPHTGANVRIRALNPGEYDSAGRYVGSVGDMSSLSGNVSAVSNNLSSSQSRSGGDIGMYGGTSEAAIVMAALSGVGGGVSSSLSSATAAGVSAAGSPTGSNPTPNGNNSKSALQSYAKALLAKYGWAGQWDSFNALEMSEAGWDVKATNPTSGAYGLPQALPGGKMASAGSDWKTNGDTQLTWMMDYIKGRYGSPDAAWSFHQKNNWYASGAWSIDKDQTATVHQGEMIIPAQQAETIRQTLLNNSFNPNVTKNSAGSGGISLGGITVNLPSSFTGSTRDARDIGKAIAKATADNLRVANLQMGQ